MIWPARPLRSGAITAPSSLLRAGPSLCPASVLCRLRCPPLAALPLATRGPTSPISTGRRHRGDRFSCSMPAPATSSRHLYTGHRQGHTQAAPWLTTRHRHVLVPRVQRALGFDATVRTLDASAVIHTCSSSRRSPDPLVAGLLPQRSPPRLLTGAACGGLGSPPARRTRRTYLHRWHSTARAGDLLHHRHSPSGHTVACTFRLRHGAPLFSQVRMEPRAYQARTTRVSFNRLATENSGNGGAGGTSERFGIWRQATTHWSGPQWLLEGLQSDA